MKIGIIAQLLSHNYAPGTAGLVEYFENLVRNFDLLNSKHELILYLPKKPTNNIDYKNIKVKYLNFIDRWPYYLWMQLRLPFEVWFDIPNLVFSPWPRLPLYPFDQMKYIITVHDLRPFNFIDNRIELLTRNFSIYAIKKASHIITISNNTKRELMQILNVSPEKISVVYNGYDHNLYKKYQRDLVLYTVSNILKSERKYILYVGSLMKHKNITTLIDAYYDLRKNSITHKLVLTGKPFWESNDVYKKIKNYGLESEVIFTGFLPKKDLALLMNGADVFVYPSLYEGFGIPPLEAMACGTPVIVSNATSLPEVVGDAAILFDPTDYRALANAIYQVIYDKQLRMKLSKKGMERAKKFSWEKTARETLKVIESVAYK